MAGTTTQGTEKLMQAYNHAVSSSFDAANAGIAQTTSAAKLIT